MGMFHSTSGKWGYNLYQVETTYKIDRNLAIQLLTEEQRLRRDEKTQNMYTNADDELIQLERITMNLQDQVLETVAGIKKTDVMYEQAIRAYRNLRLVWKNDPAVNQLTDYFMYDMSRQGHLNTGDLVNLETVNIIDTYDFDFKLDNSNADFLSTHTKSLASFLRERNTQDLPIAIIGGSYS